MFSKNSTYLQFPHESSPNSLHHHRASTNSVVSLMNGNEILLHHHQHDVISGYYLANNNVLEAEAALFGTTGLNQEIIIDAQNYNSAMSNSTAFSKKPKKDRHSKIHTAQGPRDRRVRLSIAIARKFFDLQEMLGFDKPSKTLDWLLTKSKEAIKELVQSKSGNSTNSPSEFEEVNADSKGKSVLMNSNKCKGGGKDVFDLAKESRAKARARARERTKEKMCIKQLNNVQAGINNKGYDNEWIQQFGVNNCSSAYEEELNQDSIFIKRKLNMNNPMFGFHHQQQSSNFNSIQSEINGTDNWDYSNFIASQSNQLCAILDQHKFIN